MRKVTSLIIVMVIVALSIYDIFALVSGGTEATISYILLSESKKNPVISFAFGFLMGHLFWFNKGGK